MIIKNPLIASAGGGDITTLKGYLDAVKTAEELFYHYNGNSIDNLIKYDDTENVTNMNAMFSNCSNLESIPNLNTKNVTNMNAMFNFCSKITAIPLLNTSKVSKMDSFVAGTGITTIPLLDTSNVTVMSYMFYSCKSLITVPALDCNNVTTFNRIFENCTNLKSILMTGMKVDFDISASTKFERTDLVTILNNLATVTTTQKLTMRATNLAKLTDEDKAIATNKGWTLA